MPNALVSRRRLSYLAGLTTACNWCRGGRCARQRVWGALALAAPAACTLTTGFEPELVDGQSCANDECAPMTSATAPKQPRDTDDPQPVIGMPGGSETSTEETRPSLGLAPQPSSGRAPDSSNERPAPQPAEAPVQPSNGPESNEGPIGVDGGAPAPEMPADELQGTLLGWASVDGLGVATTSGGGGSEPIVVETAADLVELAARPEPLVIAMARNLEVPRLELASNKTLIGLDASIELRGGIRVRGSADAFVSNVIIRNLTVDASASEVNGDGIQIHYAHHVWVDHCAVHDAADGLIDVVHGSDFVTLSFNHFFYTAAAADPEHRYANLIGHDDENGSEDTGRLKVTLHHNVWGEGVSAAVVARFGRVHLFENLFMSPGNDSVVTGRRLSQALLERNHFQSVVAPHRVSPGSFASLVASGNVYVNTRGLRDEVGTAFTPPYPYALESENLRTALPNAVGPR